MASVGLQKWRHNATIVFAEFIPYMLCWAVYHIRQAVKVTMPLTGRLWSRETSIFFKSGVTAIFVMLGRGLVSDMMTINISLVTYFCKRVGLSPAVIQSFSTLSSFTTALLFYLLYGERLGIQHIVGMVLIMGSVLIVAVSKSMETHFATNHGKEEDDLMEFQDSEDVVTSAETIAPLEIVEPTGSFL